MKWKALLVASNNFNWSFTELLNKHSIYKQAKNILEKIGLTLPGVQNMIYKVQNKNSDQIHQSQYRK